MFRRVLVALDREPAAERILSCVRRLLSPLRAEVRLVAVIPTGRAVVVDGRAIAYADQREDAERRAAEFRLAVLAARLREDGLSASVETRVGDPVDAVLAGALAWRADAIALAAAAARGGWRWLARDVTEESFAARPCPCWWRVTRASGWRDGGEGMQVKMLMRNSCGVIDVSEPLAAARLRLASDPGACLVAVEDGRLAGVLTDADVRAAGASSVAPISDYEWPQLTARLTVAHAMRRNPVVVGTGAAATTVARALRARGERVAVVMEGVDVVGVVHARDLLGVLADRLHRDGRGTLARLLVAASPRALARGDVGLRTPLGVACALARWHVATLTVVHVMRGLSRRVAQGVPAGVEGDLHRWRRSQARAALSRLVADLGGVRIEVRAGDLAQALLDSALETGAELLVLGGRADARLVRTMIRRAPCPVLAV